MTLSAGLSAPLAAAVKLPAMFGDHMVLQREQAVPVWGWAEPGEGVTVSFAGQRVNATAADDGTWRVELAAMAADASGQTLVVAGENRVELTGVLVGDVWLCSGQSNMYLSVSQADDAEAEIAAADFPEIRLFSVDRQVAEQPQSEVTGEWSVCSPATVGRFSAVGYFFGRQIHREVGVPVGLIHSSWGGTRAEAWTPWQDLLAHDDLRPIAERWEQEVANFPQIKAEWDRNYPQVYQEWKEEVKAARQAGRPTPSRPQLRTGPGTKYAASGLYNAMIAPWVGFGLKGVIWYQGEANAGRAEQYRTLFPVMIEAWRREWGRPELPFLWVQLPNLDRQPEPSRSGWAELRESQLMTLSLPMTGMAVTIDVGDPNDLHPTNKQAVGQRLALAAEHLVYGREAAGRLSPTPQDFAIVEGAVEVTMRAPGGLRVREGEETLRGFVVAGDDHRWVPAQAEIVGETTVRVWSPDVVAPVAVRYAWADNPDCNLQGAGGLPASPFRSDDWPEVTTGRR
ncbi:sialate O-acetylesterase [Actomonas aquatica]|uniref:Sialate O-acetylesterase n=1 Tax=Actomonas aquatica TaxID=2866162 RepID=A0ABZ1CBD1_9BACT|nr:sialate O-acetylesterase [Opitutus sp. WL0086]WRQ87879.1 sialate O-acetylesterase [Opitutus sp. WL0086]